MKENKMLGENAESKAKFFQRHKKATICIVVLFDIGDNRKLWRRT